MLVLLARWGVVDPASCVWGRTHGRHADVYETLFNVRLLSYMHDTYPPYLEHRLIQSCIHCIWAEIQQFTMHYISLYLNGRLIQTVSSVLYNRYIVSCI